MSTISTWGPLFAFLSSVTWAVSSNRYSDLSNFFSPFSVNFSRALFSLPFFISAIFLATESLHDAIQQFQNIGSTRLGWLTLSMLASYGIGDALFLWSTQALGVPGALSIASIYPLWTTAAGFFFYGEKISFLNASGAIITMAGLMIVIRSHPHSKNSNVNKKMKLSKGVTLALLTSLLWAFNSFSISAGGRGVNPNVSNSIRMFLALIFTGSFCLWFLPKTPLILPKKILAQNSWLFILEGFGGSYFYMVGMTQTPLYLGSTLSSLSPVISVVLAWITGREQFTILRTLGILLVVVGVWTLITP